MDLPNSKYLCGVDRHDFDPWKELLCKLNVADLPFYELDREIESFTLKQSNKLAEDWLYYSKLEPFIEEQKPMDAFLKFLTQKLEKPQYLLFLFDVEQFEAKPTPKMALAIQEKYCVPSAFLYLEKVPIANRYTR